VESDKVVTGYINKNEADLVHEAAATIAASRLVMTERGRTFEEFSSILRADVLKRGTRIAFVDYLQLMHMAGADHRLRRDQELGLISEGMLALTKELDITLIALAQQNRSGAKSGTNSKEDIGESYKIIQDADAAIIFREKTKDEIEADGPEKGNRVMTLDKHRHGKGGVTVNLIADLDVMRIREYTGRDVTR
jgi:replicative DNA helicase